MAEQTTVEKLLRETAPNSVLHKAAHETVQVIYREFSNGLRTAEQYIDLGWPLLTRELRCLESGLCIFGGAPNYGKSAFVLNLYLNVIKSNEDVLVLDFTLDDDAATRVNALAACLSQLAIYRVKLASNLDSELLARRRGAFKMLAEELSRSLVLFDSSSLEGRARYVEQITEACRLAREAFPDRRIVAIVDNIRNVYTERRFTAGHEKDEYVALRLTELCVKSNLLCFATAQMAKGSRARDASPDAVKGGVGVVYDAKVVGLIFNDVKENGYEAAVYHERAEPEYAGKPQPVLELNVVKNKAGAFSDVLFYRFYPEQYRIEECTEKEQEFYRAARRSVTKTGGAS